MSPRTPLAAVLLLLLSACATQGVPVTVLQPAPVNLVQYHEIAVDRFNGEGCHVMADELVEALRGATNPLTGEPGFTVLSRADVDEALDRMRNRRGDEWDGPSMERLERWKNAEVLLEGTVHDHGIEEEVVVERFTDRRGVVHRRRVRRCTARVRLELAASAGERVLDRTTLDECVTAHTRAVGRPPRPIAHGDLLAAARRRVVERYLRRVLPHQVRITVHLYKDGDLPRLAVGNGFARTGNWTAALDSYRQARDHATGERAGLRYMALYNLGVGLLYTDRFDEARAALEEAYALEQDRMILAQLERVTLRENEIERLRRQGGTTATPGR